MTTITRFTRKAALLAAATPFALLCAGTVSAQTSASPTPPPATQDTLPAAQQNAEARADAGVLPETTSDDQSGGSDIVVTGSIIRGADVGPSPVSTITAENLDARGINTV
ncbi:MAG: hypothetical protein ACK4ZY_14040, partial [Sphingomonas sp.]